MKKLVVASAIWFAPLSHSQTVDFRCELPAHQLSSGESSLKAQSVAYRVSYHVEVFEDDHFQVWARNADRLELDPVTNEYVPYHDHHFGTCCASSDEFFNVELHYGGAVGHHEIKELVSIYNLDFENGSAHFSVAGGVTVYPKEYQGEPFVPSNPDHDQRFEPYLRLGVCEFTPMENPVEIEVERLKPAPNPD